MKVTLDAEALRALLDAGTGLSNAAYNLSFELHELSERDRKSLEEGYKEWDEAEKRCREGTTYDGADRLGSLELEILREAVADYMWSEGCNCCRGRDHEKHGERLAKLLDVPKYEDDSGYDFYQFRTRNRHG